ncbi:hypothetical protein N752_07730 [Desulforamulus aquiferis]|nr:hypothetical protein [Desulforamulus aquiferis]RYD05774.1 hypothetical protein N752_07730 [Desulforamulus aquiferis]
MEIKPINIKLMNDIMINLSLGKMISQGVNWQKGEIRQGFVRSNVSGNEYLIQLGNRDITVRCNEALPTEGRILLELQGVQDGKFVVKLVEPIKPDQVSQEQLLTRIINQLQIKDTPLSRSLIQGFINQEIPLKAETLELAERLVQRLGGDTPENIGKTLLAIKMGIPQEPPIIDMVYSFLKNTNNLKHGNDPQLFMFMNRLMAILGQEPIGEQIKAPDAVQELRGVVLPQEGYDLIRKIQDYFRNISIDTPKGVAKVAAQLEVLLNSQLAQNNISLQNNQKQSRLTFKHRNSVNILELFSKLLENLRESARGASESSPARQLTQEGTLIERQIAGHQIFQMLNKAEQQDYLYFNLPFIKQDETETWGQLKIIKDNSEQKTIDLNHFSMSLMLNTLSFGPVLLELKVRNKDIMAGGKVTKEWVSDLFKASWTKLQKTFEKMGYNLHLCSWKVDSFMVDLQPKGLMNDNSEGYLQSVDVTV